MLHSSEKWYPCPFICLCVPSFKMNMLLNQGYDTLFNQPGMSSNGWQHILMIFFCIMMKFSFSRVCTWMYFYKYLTDAIFLKSSDVWCYWVLLWFSYCSIFCFVLQRRYGHSTFLPASMSLRNAPLWMKIPLTSLRYENLGFTSQ